MPDNRFLTARTRINYNTEATYWWITYSTNGRTLSLAMFHTLLDVRLSSLSSSRLNRPCEGHWPVHRHTACIYDPNDTSPSQPSPETAVTWFSKNDTDWCNDRALWRHKTDKGTPMRRSARPKPKWTITKCIWRTDFHNLWVVDYYRLCSEEQSIRSNCTGVEEVNEM